MNSNDKYPVFVTTTIPEILNIVQNSETLTLKIIHSNAFLNGSATTYLGKQKEKHSKLKFVWGKIMLFNTLLTS